jgi:hypothetical protein
MPLTSTVSPHLGASGPNPSRAKTGLDATRRLARARALDDEIRGLHRQRNRGLARILDRLVELHETRGYLALGFAGVKAYARDRLGWGAAKTKSLLQLADRLRGLPLLRNAFETGELDWTKAVLASRAARREPTEERRWLDAALSLDSRALEAKVADRTGEEPRKGRWLSFTPEQEAVLEEGLRALRSEGLDLDLEAGLAEVMRRMLQGGTAGTSRFRVLLVHCPDCRRTEHQAGRERLALRPEAAERVLCDAEVHDTRRKPARVSASIPPSVRNEVQARSGGCCEVPGCRNRAYLEFHHGHGRRAGHDADTIFHLCSQHHTAPHKGALRIKGAWSTGVRFCLADGTLLGIVGGPAASRDTERGQSRGLHRGQHPATEPLDDLGQPCQPSQASGRRSELGRQPPGGIRWRGSARPRTRGARLTEQDAAFRALRKLELPAREAHALLQRALAEQPELQTASAEVLIRAVLLGL